MSSFSRIILFTIAFFLSTSVFLSAATPLDSISLQDSAIALHRRQPFSFSTYKSYLPHTLSKPATSFSSRNDLLADQLQQIALDSSKSARHFRTYAAQARDPKADKAKLQADSYTEFLNLVDILHALQTCLEGRKGLAYYDERIPIENTLKDIVNAVKYSLNDLVDIVGRIPGFGPLLAPLLYDVKCIVDKLLNVTENLTDLTLTLLQPILSDCSLSLLGLCRAAGYGGCSNELLGLGSSRLLGSSTGAAGGIAGIL